MNTSNASKRKPNSSSLSHSTTGDCNASRQASPSELRVLAAEMACAAKRLEQTDDPLYLANLISRHYARLANLAKTLAEVSNPEHYVYVSEQTAETIAHLCAQITDDYRRTFGANPPWIYKQLGERGLSPDMNTPSTPSMRKPKIMVATAPATGVEPPRRQAALPAPYYQDDYVTIYHGDCRDVDHSGADLCVTDPPYNVGYHYESYSDDLSRIEYLELLRDAIFIPAIIVHYPEDMFKISAVMGDPEKCVAWTYNALTPRKWRMFAWFGTKPDFSRYTQPFKNQNDRRIVAAIARGKEGASLYDWWNDEQVKNVSAEKTDHPCQIPLELMKKALIITDGQTILDPFCGSGTTLVAAKQLQRKAIGIEIEEKYCEIAAKRCSQEVLALDFACPQREADPTLL